MKDFLSVKDFSRLSGVEASTLRYWDDIGLFSPDRRDTGNNYRYYSPQQLVTANFITVMSSLKIPLKKIGDMQNRRNPDSIAALIEKQERLLDMEMWRLRECYSVIHARLELIRLGSRAGSHEISVFHLDERRIIPGDSNVFPENGSYYEPFMRFCKRADEFRINLNYPIGGMHDDMAAFLAAPSQPTRFFSFDPTGNVKLEAGDYLVGYARGYYGKLGNLAERMADYAEANDLDVSGPVCVLYLHDEICTQDSADYLACASIAASRKQN